MRFAFLAAFWVAALARPALPQQGQDGTWAETRFHRVHLINGNFIDGQLIKDTPQGATLTIKSGEITVRKDLIDRIEFIKMRTFNPIEDIKEEIERKRREQERKKREEEERKKKEGGIVDPGPKPKPETVDIDPETRTKVDAILVRLKKAGVEQKGAISTELPALGVKAALYLAAIIETIEDDLLTFVGPVLGQFKSPKMQEALVKMTRSSRASVRGEGAIALGASGDPAMSRTLLPLLNDPDTIVRGNVVDSLARLGSKESIGPVSKVCIDPDRSLRGRAFAALQKLLAAAGQSDDLRRMLADLASEARGAARAEVLMTLSREAKKEDWAFLSRYLEDDDASVRQAAAFGIGNLAVPDSADAVLNRLPVEKDKWTRMYLAGGVLRLRAYKGVDELIRWLGDDDGDVRVAAWQTLKSLTGQSLDPKRELWETYWNSIRAKMIKP